VGGLKNLIPTVGFIGIVDSFWAEDVLMMNGKFPEV